MKVLDSFFKVSERGSTIRTEIIGGVITFLTMAYIIFVNPDILAETGMNRGALITVTALSAGIGTLISSIWANVPFALAPGMGLNAFFTYSLVLGKGIPWETALGIVFLSGVFFLFLSLGGVREKIANAIPMSLKVAVTCGIGLFITFIGLKNLGVIVHHPSTLVQIGKFTPTVVIGIAGLFIILILKVKKIKGAMLIGMGITMIIGIVTGHIDAPTGIMSTPPSIAPIFGKLDILGALKLAYIGPIFSFMFVDLFDSLGTLISCSRSIGLVDKEGKIEGLGKMLYTDVASTIFGSILGTSTVTTYLESGAGVAAGAKTGLASLVTSALFFLSLLFTPLIGAVPGFVTSPALIIVGVYMFKAVQELDMNNFKTLFPAFVTIVMMPLTYSISAGMALGFLSYIIIHIGTLDFKKINIPLLIIGALSLINMLV